MAPNCSLHSSRRTSQTLGSEVYHAASLRVVGCRTEYGCVQKTLTGDAGLLSGLLCLLLSRLHSLQRSFDGNQAFAQNADSIEKTIEGVIVNRG